jgi:hypothetical protein
MEAILPGVYRRTARHPVIGIEVGGRAAIEL